MKKKIIAGLILMTICFSMFSNFNIVKAFSGQLDPESYIYCLKELI